MSVRVGTTDKKEVTEFNNQLFLVAKQMMEANNVNKCNELSGAWHIGWKEVGDFIDWLEENYEMKNRT